MLSTAMVPTRERRSAHDPGVVTRPRSLRNRRRRSRLRPRRAVWQQALFGAVASERTAHRVLKSMEGAPGTYKGLGPPALPSLGDRRALALTHRFHLGGCESCASSEISNQPWLSSKAAFCIPVSLGDADRVLHAGAWLEGARLIVRRERPYRCPVRGLRRLRLPPHPLHHRLRRSCHCHPGAATAAERSSQSVSSVTWAPSRSAPLRRSRSAMPTQASGAPPREPARRSCSRPGSGCRHCSSPG